MIYQAIVIIGLLLLLMTIRSWMKLKRSVHSHRKSSTLFSVLDFSYISTIFIEWLGYVRGDKNEKQINNTIISVIFFAVVIFANHQYLHFNWIITLFVSLILLFIFQLRRGRSTKLALFEASFPEVISMITSTIASGASIHHAIGRCGQEIHTPLGNELNRISRRLNLGEDPEAVFNDAWQRFHYPEFYIFTVVILLSMQRGGQLTELMKRMGRIIAANKVMERRKAAMTSESRLSAKIIAAIPIAFILAMKFISPEDFDFLISDHRGHLILYYVATSQALGLFIIWSMIKKAT